MVSNADRRRANVSALSVASALALSSFACSRQSELLDRPDASLDAAPTVDASIPVVEGSGIDDPSLPACVDRPTGDCQGANDFPCSFEPWMYRVAAACQEATDCRTNDWVEVRTGSDGCVSEIRMVEPRADYVACLVETFGHYSCPCEETAAAYFLGLGNEGCEPACSDEFPCPVGLICVAGKCTPD
jgi:hypothetical protein